MKNCIFSSVLGMMAVATPALAQDNTIQTVPYVGTAGYGIPEPDAAQTYGVPLAPGEEIIGIHAAPPVIQVPVESGAIYETTPYAPPTDIDRVTGLPRNTPGWTGEAARPAAIGCFPQGVCKGLNR